MDHHGRSAWNKDTTKAYHTPRPASVARNPLTNQITKFSTQKKHPDRFSLSPLQLPDHNTRRFSLGPLPLRIHLIRHEQLAFSTTTIHIEQNEPAILYQRPVNIQAPLHRLPRMTVLQSLLGPVLGLYLSINMVLWELILPCHASFQKFCLTRCAAHAVGWIRKAAYSRSSFSSSQCDTGGKEVQLEGQRGSWVLGSTNSTAAHAWWLGGLRAVRDLRLWPLAICAFLGSAHTKRSCHLHSAAPCSS